MHAPEDGSIMDLSRINVLWKQKGNPHDPHPYGGIYIGSVSIQSNNELYINVALIVG